jgi:hypothetical protein
MSNILDTIARARLSEIARFFSLPADQVASWLNHLGLPAARLWEILQLMNPADEAAQPPRGWRADEKAAFAVLPAVVQEAIARREQDRERAIRKAQDDAAALRHKLTKLEHLERLMEATRAPHEGTNV